MSYRHEQALPRGLRHRLSLSRPAVLIMDIEAGCSGQTLLLRDQHFRCMVLGRSVGTMFASMNTARWSSKRCCGESFVLS